jgi:signal transduction histidine kinase
VEAVQKAGQTRPDLVLMDIRLDGDMDGIEAAEQIRAKFNIPIIFLTAYADADTLQRAKITEPFGYIIKPYQERDLHTTVEMALYKHRMDNELQLYAAQLERRNRELDTFAHTVANNLTSLASIITKHADFLRENLRLADDLWQSADILARSGYKMNQVIDELLLLAKVRQTDVSLKPIHMGRAIAAAQQRLSQLIDEYQAEINLPGDWPEVLGHAPWVEEIWVNFLSNGIIFGGQPPRLQIGATVQPNRQVRFWIRDNGPGFTGEDQSDLNAPFAQSKDKRSNERTLRLSIAQHIIEKLGGEISLETDNEGVSDSGATFSFTLPCT